MQLDDLNDYDFLCMAQYLSIRDKGSCKRINSKWKRLMMLSLATEKVLSTRLDPISKVWDSCSSSNHHATQYNTLSSRIALKELTDLVSRSFPYLTALNIYGMNIDHHELTTLSELEFWSKSLEHLEIGFCGLWINVEKLQLMLGKAKKLQHVKFAKSNGIGFGEAEVKELWTNMKRTCLTLEVDKVSDNTSRSKLIAIKTI